MRRLPYSMSDQITHDIVAAALDMTLDRPPNISDRVPDPRLRDALEQGLPRDSQQVLCRRRDWSDRNSQSSIGTPAIYGSV